MIDKRIARLTEIQEELHNIANSYAGDVTGVVAVELHTVACGIFNTLRMLKTGITEEDKKIQMTNWIEKKYNECTSQGYEGLMLRKLK
jgi:hypothetical protein